MRPGGLKEGEQGGILAKLMFLLFFVLFCAVVYFIRHPIFRLVAETWIVEDTLDPADVLIVLSDDNFYADRATRAAELFREGKAPAVVASGRRLRPNAGIAELMEHDLLERGVPGEKILRVSHDGDSTREEAEALVRVAREKKWHRVIVVTSNYHTRRARYIFQRVFPQGIDIRVASARDGDFDSAEWWEKRKSIKELMKEFAGMAVAMWELWGHREGSEKAQGVVGLRALNPPLVV